MVKLSSGLSQSDRITFSDLDSKVNATAIQMPNGEVRIEYGKSNEALSAVFTALCLFTIISIFKSFLIIPYINNHQSRVYLYLIPAMFYAFLMVLNIHQIRKVKITLKNHAAEHMVYHAYKKLKRIPTIGETRKFSRINSECGINIFSAFIMAQLIGFLLYRYAGGYVISEVALVIVPMLFSRCFPFNVIGNIAQLWTTTKPNDSNIRLAISALSALEHKVLLIEKIKSVFK